MENIISLVTRYHKARHAGASDTQARIGRQICETVRVAFDKGIIAKQLRDDYLMVYEVRS